jgi:hypothetical protein
LKKYVEGRGDDDDDDNYDNDHHDYNHDNIDFGMLSGANIYSSCSSKLVSVIPVTTHSIIPEP